MRKGRVESGDVTREMELENVAVVGCLRWLQRWIAFARHVEKLGILPNRWT